MKSIFLVGSSIFAEWSQASKLWPNCRTVNRAIGGTTTSEWIQNLVEVLPTEATDAILYYCGSNDLNCGISEERILANVRECRRIIGEEKPSSKFAYFGIIKAPQKAGKWDIIDSLNENIASTLQVGDLYVDLNPIFFCDGAPVEEFYVKDGLHLTIEAYARLSCYAAPIIDRWLFHKTEQNQAI